MEQGWKPTVRPPRLGGNQRLGVFATRSPFRPNPIGLSVVEFKGLEKRGKQWIILLGGIDLVDGTPVLDIKPYVPYADAIPTARGGFTDNQLPPTVAVSFNENSLHQLDQIGDRIPELKLLIEQVIAQQPQPAYHSAFESRDYGMQLYNLNIRWTAADGRCTVVDITSIG
jgi:hypothetical protein